MGAVFEFAVGVLVLFIAVTQVADDDGAGAGVAGVGDLGLLQALAVDAVVEADLGFFDEVLDAARDAFVAAGVDKAKSKGSDSLLSHKEKQKRFKSPVVDTMRLSKNVVKTRGFKPWRIVTRSLHSCSNWYRDMNSKRWQNNTIMAAHYATPRAGHNSPRSCWGNYQDA